MPNANAIKFIAIQRSPDLNNTDDVDKKQKLFNNYLDFRNLRLCGHHKPDVGSI